MASATRCSTRRIVGVLQQLQEAAAGSGRSGHPVHANDPDLRFGQRRHRDAIALFERTLVLDSGFTDAYLNLGSTYAALEDYEAALEPWQQLRQIQPDNAALIHNIALANARLGRLYLAIADFERALELDPGNTASRRELSLLRNRAATRNTSP